MSLFGVCNRNHGHIDTHSKGALHYELLVRFPHVRRGFNSEPYTVFFRPQRNSRHQAQTYSTCAGRGSPMLPDYPSFSEYPTTLGTPGRI